MIASAALFERHLGVVPIRLKALLYEPAACEGEQNAINVETQQTEGERNEYEALEPPYWTWSG